MSVLAVNFSFLCLLVIGCISQAPPDGTCGPNKVYTRLGNNMTIIAMTNITGEPFNIIVWIDPMDNNYFNLSSEGRYEQLQLGQLKITNVANSDIGEWVFAVANNKGNKSCSVNLALATQPGAPRDVIASDITSTTAMLTWNAPIDKGDPPLTHYKVNLTPAPPSDVVLTTVDNRTSFTLSGLVPNTYYNVTVAGVSDLYPCGDPSDPTSFTTNPGPPDIKTVSAQPDNDGNIEVKWILRHTGGVDTDLVTINIFCRRPSDLMTYTMMSSGSGSGMPRTPGSDELSGTCEGSMNTCLSNDTLMGKTKVGIVYAGDMYRCGVDVSTMAGSDFQNVSKVITSPIGKPSRPIVSAMAQPCGIKITLQAQYAGIPSSDDSFEFQVVVIYITTGQKSNRTYRYPNYTNNQMVEVMLSLPIELYNITVNAFNKYGLSEVQKVGPFNVTMSYCPSPTSTTPSPTTNPTTMPTTTSTTSIGLIVGGVVGGVIIVVLLVVVGIFIAVFIIVNNKKRKGMIKVTPGQSEKTKLEQI